MDQMSPRASINTASNTLVKHPSALLIGGIAGTLIALWWPQINELAARLYDAIDPVASGVATVTARTEREVEFTLVVTRDRECLYVKPPYAFVEWPKGDLPAKAERLDAPADGLSLPAGGTYFMGTWRISPVAGGSRARMVARYDCGGRISHAVIADIPL